MVGKVLSMMQKEIRGLHEAAYVLALFTFLSQLLALFRDRVFAHYFGAGAVLDAYFAAFRIPDIAFAALTLFVSSFALVPLLSERGGPMSRDSQRLIGGVFAVFGIVGVIVSVGLYAATPSVTAAIFPGFADATLSNTVALSRILLLQALLLGLSSIAGSMVQAMRKFFLFALAPIFYNVGIIFGALFLYPSLGVLGLAWGVVAGALLHFLIQAWPLLSSFSPASLYPSPAWLHDVKRVVTLSFPRALALSSHQLLLLLFISAASLAQAGSVAAISFAWNLQSVPLSIVGVSYASALFPSLALLFSKKETETFVKEMWAAVKHIVLWITLAIALIIVLRAHLVRVILGTGAFSWDDTRLTAAVLAGFSLSLVAQAVILIFSRAYYAAGRSLEPIIMNGGGALISGIGAFAAVLALKDTGTVRYFLEDVFRISGVPGSEIVALSLAYSAVMLIVALLFAFRAARTFGFDAHVVRSVLSSLAASVFAGAGCYATLQFFGPLLPTDTFLGIFAQGAAGAAFGILAWSISLALLKNREFIEVWSLLRRIFTQKKSTP